MNPPSLRRSREHHFLLFLALATPPLLVALGWWLHPDPRGFGTHEQLGFRPCYPMEHWNVPCPGCGVTTSVALAVRGDVPASLRTQPFGLAVLASVLTAAFWAVATHLRGRDLQAEARFLRWKRIAGTLATLMLLGWIYKLARVRGWLG